MLCLAFCLVFFECVVSLPTLKYLEDVRIVGGEDINITDAPYQVSISKAGRHHCGGSIIFDNIIVTAAHCVANSSPWFYKVRVGSSNSDRNGQIYSVNKLIWHPQFNFYHLDFDVAILRLSRPIVFKRTAANKIEMATEDEDIDDGELTVVTGWGATTENGVAPRVLQRVKVSKINDKVCSDLYSPQYNITTRMLCTGTPEGGKDACQGDSGGPLVYDNKLHGIVSWGVGCARPEYPGVYAKVSALRKWLDVNIAKIRLQRSNIFWLPDV